MSFTPEQIAHIRELRERKYSIEHIAEIYLTCPADIRSIVESTTPAVAVEAGDFDPVAMAMRNTLACMERDRAMQALQRILTERGDSGDAAEAWQLRDIAREALAAAPKRELPDSRTITMALLRSLADDLGVCNPRESTDANWLRIAADIVEARTIDRTAAHVAGEAPVCSVCHGVPPRYGPPCVACEGSTDAR